MGVLHGIRTAPPAHPRPWRRRAHREYGLHGGNARRGLSDSARTRRVSSPWSACQRDLRCPRLKPLGIGVSVLCPGFVRTRIMESQRNRPKRYGPTWAPEPQSPEGAIVAKLSELVQSGLDPSDVARRVLTAIRNDELYVFTHPERRPEVEARFAAILAAFDKAASR